jgi:nucleotide-binding universal stress UspA family protein
MKILLAMDTSAASQAALEQVASRPWPQATSVEIVSVIEPAHMWATSEVAQEASRRAEVMIRQAVPHLQASGKTATGVTLFGHPKAVIVDRAKSTGADFIVMGSHGVSGLKRFLLGSVASGILRDAPCSVEIVRDAGGRAIRKVLLATDGSELSDRAAQSIADRPWPAGTEVRVLSAVELMLPTGYALFEPPYLDTTFLETQRAEAMKRSEDAIARACKILAGSGLDSSESVSVLIEPPRTIILNEAAEWGADLIVVGSHGHRGIDRLLLGSTSEAVATHASCSVEVIRSR